MNLQGPVELRHWQVVHEVAGADRSGDCGPKQAVAGLEKILTTQFPTVPLWYGAHWFQYSTKNAVGWPNEKDPYALTTDNLLIITHLRPPQ